MKKPDHSLVRNHAQTVAEKRDERRLREKSLTTKWDKLDFGRCAGMTIPYIVFHNPSYFFWGLTNGAFATTPLVQQAHNVLRRVRHIRPRKKDAGEYAFLIEVKRDAKHEIEKISVVKSAATDLLPAEFISSSHLDLSIAYGLSRKSQTMVASFLAMTCLNSTLAKLRESDCQKFIVDDRNFDLECTHDHLKTMPRFPRRLSPRDTGKYSGQTPLMGRKGQFSGPLGYLTGQNTLSDE